MLDEKTLLRRIEEVGKIRRWYQSVPYGAIHSPDQNFHDGKTDPRSFGQGRYDNYIDPMLGSVQLDIQERTPHVDLSDCSLCEVGCSAGLFLLWAWRIHNLRRLIGVEAGEGAFAQLEITRDFYDELPFEIHKLAVGPLHENIAYEGAQQIDMQTFPIVDITLMSCVHYYIPEDDLRWYLSLLAEKSMYLLILTDEAGHGVVPVQPEWIHQLVKSLDCWDLIDEQPTRTSWLEENRTRTDRQVKKLMGMVYRSQVLQRMSTETEYSYVCNANAYSSAFYRHVFPPFIEAVLQGKITPNNLERTQVYDWQRKGLHGSKSWLPTIARARTHSYYNMVLSMKDHGQEQPIMIHPRGMVDRFDGFHRVAVAHHFGIPYVYGKDLPLCSDPT